MKKLLTLAMGALLACGMTACGSNYDKTVLAYEEGTTANVVGGFDAAEWVDQIGKKVMTASSVDGVAKVSKDAAKKLSGKSNIKAIYLYEGLEIKDDADWGGEAKNPWALVNGEKKQFNPSHAVKVVVSTPSKAQNQFVSDPHTAHAEALTDNFFVPVWQEELDDNGFSWADNTIITSEKGKYTIIFAEYAGASTPEHVQYGLGAVRTGDVA